MKVDFNEAPVMPELPPMQPMQIATPHMGGAIAQQPRGSFQGGGRSLRRLLGLLSSGGLVLVLGVGGLEMIAKDGLRPSQLLAQFQASHDLEEMRQKNPGMMILNEADYQAKMGEAQRAGQAKAELDYQKKLAAVQSDMQRVTGAYSALYQRTGQLAGIALNMEASLQQARQQTVMQGQAGTAMSANLKDMWCALSGDTTACASASADRSRMVSELNDLATMDEGSRVRELMKDIPDPATLVVNSDLARNGAPSLER